MYKRGGETDQRGLGKATARAVGSAVVASRWALTASYTAYLASGGLFAVIFALLRGDELRAARVIAFCTMVGMAVAGTFIILELRRLRLPPVVRDDLRGARWPLGVLLINGVAWFYIVIQVHGINYDGGVYRDMALALVNQHVLSQPPNLGRHFGPLYPLYLSPFYLVSQDDLATRAAILVLGLLALAVIYLTTRRLYGPGPAGITVALVLGVPTLLTYTAKNGGEFLVAALYTLTIYCLYLSTSKGKEALVILAGLFAGMAFLTKSSSGYLFLLAGAAGFLWRFRHVHWRIFRDVYYWAAVGVFLLSVAAWVTPSLLAAWSPSTGLGGLAIRGSGDLFFASAYQYAIGQQPWMTLLHFLMFGAFMLPFLLSFAWPFLPGLRWVRAPLGDERIGLLMIAVIVPLLVGGLVSSIYYVFQHYQANPEFPNLAQETNYFMANVVRYIFIALIPLTWLIFEIEDRHGPAGPSSVEGSPR